MQSMDTEADFHALLRPQPVAEDRFRGFSMPLEQPAIFGGQLMAQVLGCAASTLDTPRPVHYLQCDFVAGGDPKGALDFEVTRIRDGRSTSHRAVTVSQEGKTLMLASLSFQQISSGYDHQAPMPSVSLPDQLLQSGDSAYSLSGDEQDDGEFPFVMLTCPPGAGDHAARSDIWTRSRDTVVQDTLLHQQLFAFVSDTTILQSALNAHQLDWRSGDLVVTTMNHSIWYHRPLDINDWFLMHSESPSSNSGRAFSTANVFALDGGLVATIAQEGILRTRAS